MAATTPSAILAAIKELVEGLTPAGGTASGMNAAFKQAADTRTGMDEDRPPTDLDRQFVLTGIVPQRVQTMASGLDTHDHLSELQVVIGHVCGTFSTDRDRRDKDLHQLAAQLQHVDSYPAGVSRIILTGTDVVELYGGNFWASTMTFEINYAMTANYGGS